MRTLSHHPQRRGPSPPGAPDAPTGPQRQRQTASEEQDPSKPPPRAPSHTPVTPQLVGGLGTQRGCDAPRGGVGKERLFRVIGPKVQPLDSLQPGPLDSGGWGDTGGREARPRPHTPPCAAVPCGRTGGQGPDRPDVGVQRPFGGCALACPRMPVRRAGSAGVPSGSGLLERRPGPSARGEVRGRRPCGGRF